MRTEGLRAFGGRGFFERGDVQLNAYDFVWLIRTTGVGDVPVNCIGHQVGAVETAVPPLPGANLSVS